MGGVFISLIAEPAGGRTDPKPPFPHPKTGGVCFQPMAAKEQAYSRDIQGGIFSYLEKLYRIGQFDFLRLIIVLFALNLSILCLLLSKEVP